MSRGAGSILSNVAMSQLLDSDERTELLHSDEQAERATLYHLLTGVKPISDPDRIVKPSELDPSIGESISIILMKALSKDPR